MFCGGASAQRSRQGGTADLTYGMVQAYVQHFFGGGVSDHDELVCSAHCNVLEITSQTQRSAGIV